MMGKWKEITFFKTWKIPHPHSRPGGQLGKDLNRRQVEWTASDAVGGANP